MNDEYERVPPADPHAEMSVLGSMMLSRAALDEVTEILAPGDFYRPAHEAMYAALVALWKTGSPVDGMTAVAELERRGDLERVGGAPYVHDCVSTPPTAANASYYARIVAAFATRRRMIAAGTRVTQMGYQPGDDTLDDLIERARSEIDSCARSISDVHLIADDLADTIRRFEEPDDAIPTPWSDLNYLIGGLKPGALYIVGARPGVGKSLMASGLARACAEKGGVVFNSLEMSNHEVYERMLAAESSIEYRRFTNRSLTGADYERMGPAVDTLTALPISVDDRAGVGVTDVRSHARSMARRGPLSAVIVDYLQLMRTPAGDRRPRHEVVGDMSRSLKLLAKEMHVPVVAVCQLNRASTSRADQKPTMADLRESGSLEQDANVVILLHVDDDGDPSEMRVHVAKNRMGQTGATKLKREGHYARLVTAPWRPAGIEQLDI